MGVDIVDVRRVARLLRRKRELSRLFSPEEVAYCSAKRHPAQHFAVRFAAKEAVYKALGQPALTFSDVSVQNESTGRPRVVLSKKFKSFQKGLSLTLSHTELSAVAVAVYAGTRVRSR